jgi:hypothetical protein
MSQMTPAYINALQAVLDRFESTFFDNEMNMLIRMVRSTGNTLIPPTSRPLSNPPFYSALVPYVRAVQAILNKFERTYYDVDMISRIKLAKAAGEALLPPASKITRYEDENGDNYGYWTTPYNNYLPYDAKYKKAIKHVFDKFDTTFYDEIMSRLIRTLRASE